MTNRIYTPILIILISMFAINCSDMGDAVVTQSETEEFFELNIQPIFSANCGNGSCHIGGGAAGLDLSPGSAYDNIYNTVGQVWGPAVIVVPGDAANSILWHKLTDSQVFGQIMPPGGSLNPMDITLIEDWINAGAPLTIDP